MTATYLEEAYEECPAHQRALIDAKTVSDVMIGSETPVDGNGAQQSGGG